MPIWRLATAKGARPAQLSEYSLGAYVVVALRPLSERNHSATLSSNERATPLLLFPEPTFAPCGPLPLPFSRSYGFVTFADRASADAVKKIRQADFMGRTMNFGDAVQGGLGKARVALPGVGAGQAQLQMGRGGPAGVPGGVPMGYGMPWPAGAPGMLPPGARGMLMFTARPYSTANVLPLLGPHFILAPSSTHRPCLDRIRWPSCRISIELCRPFGWSVRPICLWRFRAWPGAQRSARGASRPIRPFWWDGRANGANGRATGSAYGRADEWADERRNERYHYERWDGRINGRGYDAGNGCTGASDGAPPAPRPQRAARLSSAPPSSECLQRLCLVLHESDLFPFRFFVTGAGQQHLVHSGLGAHPRKDAAVRARVVRLPSCGAARCASRSLKRDRTLAASA